MIKSTDHEDAMKRVDAGRKVSVIIVNWNGERFLEQCLRALMTQTVRPYEVVLLDNFSSDSSLQIVRQFTSVKVVSLDQNVGFAKGNNLAIAAASADTDWIALINPDAYAEPRWLEALLASSASHPDYDVFGSKLLIESDPALLDGIGDAYHMSGRVWRTGHGAKDGAVSGEECEIFSPCAAAAMYRYEVLLEAGGFDEDYFCYVEDVDLGFRLRLAGYRCLYVPQSIAHHVGSGTTGGQHSDFSVYYGHRNLVWTFVKNMPGLLFWLLLPMHLLLNIFSVIWLTLRGQGGVALRAKRDALLGLPKMWSKRHRIQALRVASVGAIWQQLDKRLNMSKQGRGEK